MLWTLDGMLLFVIYTPLVFECFVKKKRLLSQQNVNKTSVTQRKRPKKENNSSCSFYKTIKCNNNVNDSNKNVKLFCVFLLFSLIRPLFKTRSYILHEKYEI